MDPISAAAMPRTDFPQANPAFDDELGAAMPSWAAPSPAYFRREGETLLILPADAIDVAGTRSPIRVPIGHFTHIGSASLSLRTGSLWVTATDQPLSLANPGHPTAEDHLLIQDAQRPFRFDLGGAAWTRMGKDSATGIAVVESRGRVAFWRRRKFVVADLAGSELAQVDAPAKVRDGRAMTSIAPGDRFVSFEDRLIDLDTLAAVKPSRMPGTAIWVDEHRYVHWYHGSEWQLRDRRLARQDSRRSTIGRLLEQFPGTALPDDVRVSAERDPGASVMVEGVASCGGAIYALLRLFGSGAGAAVESLLSTDAGTVKIHSPRQIGLGRSTNRLWRLDLAAGRASVLDAPMPRNAESLIRVDAVGNVCVETWSRDTLASLRYELVPGYEWLQAERWQMFPSPNAPALSSWLGRSLAFVAGEPN